MLSSPVSRSDLVGPREPKETDHSLFRPTKKPCKWPSNLPRALPVGIGAVRRRNPSTALRYSAAAGDATLGELAEWDPEFAEPFAPGALISASGLSERRDFPSK